jgi:autotransporter-associated beta strand protein
MGSGTLALTGEKRYSGATTVQAGTLLLVGSQQAATTTTVSAGRVVYALSDGNVAYGNVVMAGSNTSTVFNLGSGASVYNGTLSGSGSVGILGTGSLTVTKSLLQTGDFVLSGGTFKLGASSVPGSLVSLGGSLGTVVLNAGTLERLLRGIGKWRETRWWFAGNTDAGWKHNLPVQRLL